MSIPRKGSRLIVVDDVRYRWRVRQRATYTQAVLGHTLTVAVEIADDARCTLVADLSRAHPANWFGDPSAPVTPAEVAELIRKAIAGGWEPTSPGGAFKISVVNTT